jgi:hypothetical protein
MRHVRDRVHERNVDLDSFGDEVLNFSEHLQVVLGLNIFRVGGVEASDETTKGSDTNSFTNTENS